MAKARNYMQDDQSKKWLDVALVRQILVFAKPYKAQIALAFATLMLAQFLPFFFPHLLGQLIDGPVAHRDLGAAWNLLLIYLALVALQASCAFVSSMLSKVLAYEIIHDLRKKLFNHILNLNMPFFHKNPIGRLMTRVTSDVDSLLSLFSDGLLELLGMVMMLIFATVFMLLKDWQMALATMAVMPFMVAITMVFRVKVRDINRIIRAELASLNSVMQENLVGIRIVQLFFRQKKRLDLFDQYNSTYKAAFLRNVRYYSWFFPGMNGLSDVSLAFCYGVGAYMIAGGHGTVGELVAFAWYATMFHRPLREISDKITQLQSSLAAGERVMTLLENSADLEKDGERRLEAGALSVDFDQVHFAYREDQPVLRGLDLRIQAGETLAVVGPTGAGKSTLFQLLNRFYASQSGQVRMGGIPVAEIASQDLRSRVALVSQDVFLFEDSLLQNIVLGETHPDPERLQRALSYSRLEKVLDVLPQGLESPILEGGKNLSAGQRQLVSFARALYREPDLLLLDEATSAIDSATEALIQEALPDLLEGRTAIIIAHRLSTVFGADRIAVLHHGQVEELGSHAELMELDGIYGKLVKMNKKNSKSTLQDALNQL